MGESQELTKLFWFIIKIVLLALFLDFCILNVSILLSILTLIIAIFLFFLAPIFTFFSFISTLAWAFIFLILGMIFLVIPGIMLISTFISRIGFYHKNVSEKCEIPRRFYHFLAHGRQLETFQINFPEMFWNYLVLSFPLYFTFIYLLNPSNFLEISCSCLPDNINNAFIASLAAIPVYLLSIRLLTNPFKKEIIYLRVIKGFYEYEKSMPLLKERILSFYFALTATAFFIMVIDLIYKSLGLGSDEIIFWISVLNLLKKSFWPLFTPFQIFLYGCAYIIALFILTGCVEFLLQKGDPIDLDE